MNTSMQHIPRWALVCGISILTMLLSAIGTSFFSNAAKVSEELQLVKIQLGRIEEHVRRIEGIQLSQAQVIQQSIIFAQERGERLSRIEADMLTTRRELDIIRSRLFRGLETIP